MQELPAVGNMMNKLEGSSIQTLHVAYILQNDRQCGRTCKFLPSKDLIFLCRVAQNDSRSRFTIKDFLDQKLSLRKPCRI